MGFIEEPSLQRACRLLSSSAGHMFSTSLVRRLRILLSPPHLYLSCSMIDIRRLKRFASGDLPINSQLRNVLLSEKDTLTANDFLAKMGTWMTLLNLETRSS